MQSKLAVITCAHNPRPDYLGRVIEALKNQSLPKGLWEYLLIDNASKETLAAQIDLSWHPNARHIREEHLGLTRARLRGINEAAAEILVFVDDDNVLDPDYLEQTLRIASEWPIVGAWSGQTRPEFEVLPAEWTKRYWGSLAIRNLNHDAWSNLPHLDESMPCGAGLCVRQNVAAHYAHLHSSGQRELLLDRAGGSLASAGDNDLAACACDVGLGVGLFVALRLTHLIPAARLEEEYLLRLTESIARSGVIFRSFRSAEAVSHRGLTNRVADLLRQVLMSRRERRFFRAYKRGEARAYKYLAQSRQTEISRVPTEQTAP